MNFYSSSNFENLDEQIRKKNGEALHLSTLQGERDAVPLDRQGFLVSGGIKVFGCRGQMLSAILLPPFHFLLTQSVCKTTDLDSSSSLSTWGPCPMKPINPHACACVVDMLFHIMLLKMRGAGRKGWSCTHQETLFKYSAKFEIWQTLTLFAS